DLIWFDNSHLVLPESLRLRVLKDHHDALLAGHPAHKVTKEHKSCHYHWIGIDKDIQEYIKSCEEYQRNKDSTKKPGSLLQPLPILSQPWELISMDFTRNLPKSKSRHDAITVFVDCLTKMAHFAVAKTTDTAKDIAEQFIAKVISQHG